MPEPEARSISPSTWTSPGYERGGQATTAHLGFEREFWELVEAARKPGKTTDLLVRQQLAWAYTGVQAHALQRARRPGAGGRGPPARPGGLGGQAPAQKRTGQERTGQQKRPAR
jgi:hypothetical protein